MNYTKKTLKNKVELITFPNKQLETFAVGVYFASAGSSSDFEGKRGINNVLFQLLQRKTAKFNTYKDLQVEVESRGGSLESVTRKDYSAFIYEGVSKNQQEGLDILVGIINNPKFTKKNLDKVKENVISKINSLKSDPLDYALIEFHGIANKDTNYSHYTKGIIEDVKSITLEDIKTAYSRLLKDKVYIFTLGNMDNDTVYKIFETNIDNLELKKDKELKDIPKTSNKAKIISTDLEQPIIISGIRGPSMESNDYFTYVALTSLFGSGMSSFIYDEVRTKRGLAYYMLGGTIFYKPGSWFFAYGGVNKDSIKDVVQITKKQFNRLNEGDFSKEDIKRAINYKLSNAFMRNEGLSDRLELISQHYILGSRIFKYRNYKKEFNKVTREKVIELAKNINTNGLVTVINGSEVESEKVEELTK